MVQGTLSILLVEDEQPQAHLIEEYLDLAEGLQPVTCWVRTLSDAEEKLDQETFDVVLLDLGLPDSTGIDTFTRIMGLKKRIPVVVLTGMSRDEVALEALRGGAQDYLVKGEFTHGALARSLRHAVERNRLREEARRSALGLRTVLETSRDGIMVLDMAGRVQYVNPVAERLIGQQDTSSLGEMLHLPISMESGAEVRLDRPDGTYVTVELQMTSTEWDGRPALFILLRDVTREREGDEVRKALADKTTALEESEKLMEERSRFINLVTHELRTPMTAISSGVQMLITGGLGEINPQQQRFLEMIQRNTERLVRFSSDVLSLSRLESGTYPLRISDVPLAATLAPVVATLSASAQANTVSLEVVTEEVEPVMVTVDPDALCQVVTNLVSNAIVHCPAGTTVHLRWQSTPSGKLVEVEVADDGPGIPEHERELLFKPSYQATGNRRSETQGVFYKGTGLGLSICKHLVEAMGGQIKVETSQGEGTAFIFTLPLV